MSASSAPAASAAPAYPNDAPPSSAEGAAPSHDWHHLWSALDDQGVQPSPFLAEYAKNGPPDAELPTIAGDLHLMMDAVTTVTKKQVPLDIAAWGLCPPGHEASQADVCNFISHLLDVAHLTRMEFPEREVKGEMVPSHSDDADKFLREKKTPMEGGGRGGREGKGSDGSPGLEIDE